MQALSPGDLGIYPDMPLLSEKAFRKINYKPKINYKLQNSLCTFTMPLIGYFTTSWLMVYLPWIWFCFLNRQLGSYVSPPSPACRQRVTLLGNVVVQMKSFIGPAISPQVKKKFPQCSPNINYKATFYWGQKKTQRIIWVNSSGFISSKFVVEAT